MSTYGVLLFLHIAAAIVWLGGGFLFQILGTRAVVAADPPRMGTIVGELNAMSTRLFIPSSLAVFVLGVLLVFDGPWSFGDAWIVVGLAGYAATFLTGLFFIKPQGEKIGAVMERDGGASPAAFDEIRKMMLIARVDLVVLFVVVFDMAVKPSTDDVGALVLMAAAVVAAAVYSTWRSRASGADAPPAREPA